MALTSRATEKSAANKRGVFTTPSALTLLAAAVLAVLAGFGIYFLKTRGSDAERGTALLVEGYSRLRLIEPRLSGGFKGAEFRSNGDKLSDIETEKLDRGRKLIMDAVDRGGALEQLAYARLVLTKGEKLAEAVRYLRRALAALPESAEGHNDLGVCLSQQGKVEDAIDEFETALKLKPDMPEALFNRGLCYERLMLREAASADYGRLLEVERDGTWLNEVKQRHENSSGAITPKKEAEIVGAFDKALADNDVDEAKRLADANCETIIKHAQYESSLAYLQAKLSSNEDEAARALFELNFIGKHLQETRGDACIADLAAHLNGLSEAERATGLELINKYKEEAKLVGKKSGDESQAAFERLAGQFDESGNDIFQYSSIFYIATLQYSSGHLASSITFAKRCQVVTERHTWPFYRANVLTQLAIAHARLGRDAIALGYCDEAIQATKNLLLAQAKAFQYKAIAYDHLGDLERRIASLVDSTRLYLASVPNRREIANNYLDMCEAYQARGNHRLAMLCGSSSLKFADLIKDDSRAAQASAFTAIEYERLNQSEKAEEFLELGRRYLSKVEHDRLGHPKYFVESFAAQIAEHRGDYQGAERCYSEAESALKTIEDSRILHLRMLRARAETYEKAGEFDKARLDLKQAIAKIEEYFKNIAASEDRSSFLDASQGVFDQLIALDVREFQRNDEAFNLSEQSRARTLLDDFSAQQRRTSPEGRMKPLEMEAVRHALPEGLRLLTYAVTKDRTFLFLLTREGLEVEQSDATAEVLDRLVSEYVSGLKEIAPIGEVNEKAKELYNYLIAPVERKIRDGKTLCIAPDKTLHLLPFAALVDQADRYLMESCIVTYTPSASALAICIGDGIAKPQDPNEAILTVGNPDFDRTRFPQLQDLPDSEREAIDSAGFYSRRTILNWRQATEGNVKRALKDCDVAHFAVHCLVEEKSPWLAALVLTGKETESDRGAEGKGADSSPVDGLLRLQEIYGLNLRHTRLVVLSACQSGLGRYYKGEGMVSLVRPFLALRVQTVVASLWPVDSRATSALMIDFHRERKRIGYSSEALRMAQFNMTNSETYKHPYYWAPFIAVGSNN